MRVLYAAIFLLFLGSANAAFLIQLTNTPPPPSNCPFGTALADGCSGAQAHGTIVDAHLADAKQVIDLNIAGGSGYTNGTYTWTSSGGGCSVAATGTITVTGGVLGGGTNGTQNGYAISNQGSGCTSRPTISVPAGAGAGTGGSIVPTVYQVTPHNCTSVTACNSVVAANWNLPGVDYPVGLDTTLSLQDPTTAGLPTGCTYSSPTVTCAGSGGTLNGYDFTLHNTKLHVTAAGWTISNNNFICGPHGTSLGAMITVGAVASVTFIYNTMNGNDTIGGTVCDSSNFGSFVNSTQTGTASFVFEYNLCYNFDSKCYNFQGGSGGGTITATDKYNYYYNIGLAGSTHGESQYAYFSPNTYTVNWELGFNVAVNRWYVTSSNATAPLAQQADAYTLNTNTHHNYAMVRGNQSYTGSNNANALNSAPMYLGEQNDPGTGTITGSAANNILDYSGSFFPYNKGSSFGAVAGNVADFNAGTGNTCTVSSGGAMTCN